MTFEEEVDRAALSGHGPLPHHEYSPWLALLPLLCAAALAINVRWRRRASARAPHRGATG